MKDFHLDAYKVYLNLIKKKFNTIITFDKYLSSQSLPDEFCILRHDVDRFPFRALNMAILENKMVLIHLIISVQDI